MAFPADHFSLPKLQRACTGTFLVSASKIFFHIINGSVIESYLLVVLLEAVQVKKRFTAVH